MSGVIALSLFYLVSAIGDVGGSLILVGSFLLDIVFFLIVYSTVIMRTNNFLLVAVVFMLIRFFSVPQRELWFMSLPMAASHLVVGKLFLEDFSIAVLLYYFVALMVYRRGVRE